MFYMNLANQIYMFIVVVFSSYIYISSLTVKPDTPYVKHYSTAFFIPLVLSLMSFLSLNAEHSASYIFFAEFILITAQLIIILFEKNGELRHVIFFSLYAVPLVIGILNLNFDSLNRSSLMDLIISVYLGIISVIIISCVLLKKYSRIAFYWGIFAVCASLLVVHLKPADYTEIISLLLKGIGYTLFAFYFYRSTIYRLEEAHIKSSAQLERINQSVQREVNRRVEAIERSNRKLVEISKTDNLTGTYTRKAFIDMVDNLLTKRPESEFSILMFDIDNFKEINDNDGHLAGDRCLKELVSIARNSLRGDDRLGRYGGDEFIILLPDTGPVKAYLVAERFRKNVETTKDPHFTISIGISSYPMDARTSKALINAADKALYLAKNKGKNVVAHTGQLDGKE